MKRTPVITWITTFAVLVSLCASLTFSQRSTAQSSDQSENRNATDNKYPTLSKYATDLTQLALSGKLEPARGYEAIVARVIASLSTSTKAPFPAAPMMLRARAT